MSHLKEPKSEEMKYLKNTLQKIKNSILELEKFIRESKDKIRKDFRELKDRKIKIRKKLEQLLLNPNVFTKTWEGFSQPANIDPQDVP